ncbi:Ribokinase-like protein [Gilbertella persicaria]|uniref:Ribokinase-like protein n=1 Tax=Gilbertella persicaria TaxID=101096 RepID=UPI00221F6F14|nr:Ribokinase-like protein [Gilbertella persicaria]KAI8063678.1 Ribokinase-like protein [Gilbertella persicaria]
MVFFSKKKRCESVQSSSYSIASSRTLSRSSSFLDEKPFKVLLVGQIYQDTILKVDAYPQEDSKSQSVQQMRCGGNCVNTAEVLVQFSRTCPYVMSAVGPKETTAMLLTQLESKGIKTSTCYHRKQPTPSCYIISTQQTGSRTIISCNTIQGITKDEFARRLEMNKISKTMSLDFDPRQPTFHWAHFEGRNVSDTLLQIDWIETKAKREGWRDKITISVEIEHPDRPLIDDLVDKGDVVFFSKLYAEKRGYTNSEDFIRYAQMRCKPGAILFCTWGAQGATCSSKIGDILHAPAVPCQVVDCIGAGDTFIAAVIHGLGRGYSLWSTLTFACELASRKVSQFGFNQLLMDEDELIN